MSDDELDELIDDATHAVNDLIPDKILNNLTPSEHSDLLVRINDALSPILSELF